MSHFSRFQLLPCSQTVQTGLPPPFHLVESAVARRSPSRKLSINLRERLAALRGSPTSCLRERSRAPAHSEEQEVNRRQVRTRRSFKAAGKAPPARIRSFSKCPVTPTERWRFYQSLYSSWRFLFETMCGLFSTYVWCLKVDWVWRISGAVSFEQIHDSAASCWFPNRMWGGRKNPDVLR